MADSWLQGEIITNPPRPDGFGAQFQTIIYAVMYADLNHQKYLYTPFGSMEHNYDGDPDFLKKKEDLINFIGNFEINDGLNPEVIPKYAIEFFEANINRCEKSSALKKIKAIFRLNKNKKDYFDNNNLNIAVHVRRPNEHDSRIAGSDVPDNVYLKIIDLLRDLYASQKPLFHLYSQGDIEVFKQIYGADDVVLHINGPVEEVFTPMVLADVLVTTISSLSYTAGMLSEGVVFYIPFWHSPFSNWIPCKITGDDVKFDVVALTKYKKRMCFSR